MENGAGVPVDDLDALLPTRRRGIQEVHRNAMELTVGDAEVESDLTARVPARLNPIRTGTRENQGRHARSLRTPDPLRRGGGRPGESRKSGRRTDHPVSQTAVN